MLRQALFNSAKCSLAGRNRLSPLTLTLTSTATATTLSKLTTATLQPCRTFSSTNTNTNTNTNKPDEPIMGPGAPTGSLPSAFEHAVGLERLQLLSELAGRSLFSASSAASHEPLQHPRGADVKGTLTDPVLVECLEEFAGEGRIVGCSGQPRGSHEIGFFWVRSAGEATRCPECGQAFRLKMV